jgi:hypothetical protein
MKDVLKSRFEIEGCWRFEAGFCKEPCLWCLPHSNPSKIVGDKVVFTDADGRKRERFENKPKQLRGL